MSKIGFIKDQIIESRNFVNRLISEMPEDLWFTIPQNTDSNFAWQIGHLMMSQNFHAITVITGKNENVFNLIPVANYVKVFNGMGSLHRSVDIDFVSAKKLKEQFDIVHQICIENLDKLTDGILQDKLEPIPFKHPIAEIKYEALSWSFKHEMWHSAEMEDIKRALGHPIKWM
jgi:hypothetical protein